MAAKYLPLFPLQKGNFNWTMGHWLTRDTPTPNRKHHTPTRDPGLGPRHNDWMGLGVDFLMEALSVFCVWK